MTQLVRYEAARRALSECKAVDEVKDWVDRAAAMQAYQRMAGDKDLEIDAAEIRIRAERKLGELISAQKATVGLNHGTRLAGSSGGAARGESAVATDDRRFKLADVGISKDLSSRSQKLAAVPEAEFESEVGEWRNRVKAEGTRVSARLEKAGERALNKQAMPAIPQGKALYDIEYVDELQVQVTDLMKDNESMVKVFESDDRLAAATAEIKRLNALITVLEDRNRGMMNECNEAKRLARSWKNRYEKLERECKAAGLVDF